MIIKEQNYCHKVHFSGQPLRDISWRPDRGQQRPESQGALGEALAQPQEGEPAHRAAGQCTGELRERVAGWRHTEPRKQISAPKTLQPAVYLRWESVLGRGLNNSRGCWGKNTEAFWKLGCGGTSHKIKALRLLVLRTVAWFPHCAPPGIVDCYSWKLRNAIPCSTGTCAWGGLAGTPWWVCDWFQTQGCIWRCV